MKHDQFAAKVILKYLHGFSRYHNRLSSKGDVLAVHQLRVNARRLRNALGTFKSLFPKKKIKAWDKVFKEAAKSASQTRDLDVYVDFLRKYSRQLKKPDQKKHIFSTIKYLQHQRNELMPEVLRQLQALRTDGHFIKLNHELENTLKAAKSYKSKCIYEVCRRRIVHITGRLLSFEGIVGDPNKKEELHRMRIQAKHLRYTLEGVRAIYDKRIEHYIVNVLRFHKILGDIHDYDVWCDHVDDYANEAKLDRDAREALAAVKRYCLRMRKSRYNEFLKLWKQTLNNHFFEDLLEFVYAHES